MSLASENEARARFLKGQETRQLFARDTRDPDGPLYFLGDGDARSVRSLCKAGHLVCPDEECEHREFTTVGAAGRRHHFRHLVSGSGHGLEGYLHVVGKHLLAEWARAAVPGTTTVIEAGITTVNRRADALATTPDGRRYALEMQYAALDFESWKARDDDYRTAGIVPIWVFGHLAPHLVAGRGSAVPGQVRISKLHEQILAAGRGPIVFLDPNHLELAQLFTHWDAVAIKAVEPDMPLPHLQTDGILGICPLSECTLSAGGMVSAWATRLQAGRDVVRREALLRRERERLARERQEAVAATLKAAQARERDAAAAAAKNRRDALRDRERQGRAAAVARVREEVTRARARVSNLEHPALAAPGPSIGEVPASAWRLPLYREWFYDHAGAETSAPAIYRHASWLLKPIDSTSYETAVTDWLFALRAMRLVDFADLDQLVVGRIRVLGDVDAPPPADVAQPRRAMDVLLDGHRWLAVDRARGAIFAIDRKTGRATGERCDLNALGPDQPCPSPGTLAAPTWHALRRREHRAHTPTWVLQRLHTDVRVAGDPADWHAAIWARHVVGRAGASYDFEQLMQTMVELGCGRSVFAEDALFGFLNHLRKNGALRFSAENARPTTRLEVLAAPARRPMRTR